MKKLIAIGIGVIMGLGISILSYAADPIETSKDIAVSMSVFGADFGFQIWDTQYTQDLGTKDAGQDGVGSITFYAHSNHAVPWYIQAASDGLIGKNPVPDTLPIIMTTYDVGKGAEGTFVTDLPLASAAQNIYSAGAAEYPVSGLEFGSTFVVKTTLATQEDVYEGIIELTMTE